MSHAAYLVSIFWAAVTIGRAVAVGQAMLVGPSWSLRLQLLISMCGASTFFLFGAQSFHGAAVAAVRSPTHPLINASRTFLVLEIPVLH